VAYLRADGGWGTQLSEARLFEDEEATKPNVAHAQKNEQFTVSDPYGIDVHVGESGIVPLTKRESIRALGPTTPLRRPDSGRERLPV
jgi:hypothetical protein